MSSRVTQVTPPRRAKAEVSFSVVELRSPQVYGVDTTGKHRCVMRGVRAWCNFVQLARSNRVSVQLRWSDMDCGSNSRQ